MSLRCLCCKLRTCCLGRRNKEQGCMHPLFSLITYYVWTLKHKGFMDPLFSLITNYVWTLKHKEPLSSIPSMKEFSTHLNLLISLRAMVSWLFRCTASSSNILKFAFYPLYFNIWLRFLFFLNWWSLAIAICSVFVILDLFFSSRNVGLSVFFAIILYSLFIYWYQRPWYNNYR